MTFVHLALADVALRSSHRRYPFSERAWVGLCCSSQHAPMFAAKILPCNMRRDTCAYETGIRIALVSSLTRVDLRPNSRLPRVDASPVSNKHIVMLYIVHDSCLQMQPRLRVATPFRLHAQQGPPHSRAVPHSPCGCLTLSLFPTAPGPGASNAAK